MAETADRVTQANQADQAKMVRQAIVAKQAKAVQTGTDSALDSTAYRRMYVSQQIQDVHPMLGPRYSNNELALDERLVYI